MLIVRERSRHCCIILFVSRIRYALALAWRRYRKKLTNMNEACSDLPTFFIGCLWPFKLRRRRRRRQERRQHHRLLVKPIATRAKQNSLCTHTFDALSDRRRKKKKKQHSATQRQKKTDARTRNIVATTKCWFHLNMQKSLALPIYGLTWNEYTFSFFARRSLHWDVQPWCRLVWMGIALAIAVSSTWHDVSLGKSWQIGRTIWLMKTVAMLPWHCKEADDFRSVFV